MRRNNMFAMAALMAMGGAGGMLAEASEPRPTNAPIKRKRNYDLEGPEPKAGPPTAREANMPSRQQRRWLARQAAKK